MREASPLLLLLGLSTVVTEYVPDLTGEDFNATLHGRGFEAAFIKFYAPWCTHCHMMEPAWLEVGEEYEDSQKMLIGTFDCTALDNQEICQQMMVASFPTLMYFVLPDKTGEVYEGPQTVVALKAYAKKLVGMCRANKLDECTSREQKKDLESMLDMGVEHIRSMASQAKEKLLRAKARLLDAQQAMSKLENDKKMSHAEKDDRAVPIAEEMEEAQKANSKMAEEVGERLRVMKAVLAHQGGVPEIAGASMKFHSGFGGKETREAEAKQKKKKKAAKMKAKAKAKDEI